MAYSLLPVGVVVTTAVVLAAVVSNDLALWQRPLVGIGGALAGFAWMYVVLRFAHLGVYVDRQGVCVRRLTKTMRFCHAQVTGFSVEPWRDLLGRVAPTVAVNLTSGDKIVIPQLGKGSPVVIGGASLSEIVSRLTEAQSQYR